jgi:hypothetical protein
LPSAVEQPLDGAGAAVTDRPGSVDPEPADPVTELVADRRRGRLLDELLVTALDRAVAFAQVNDVAVRVREDLDFDVPRVFEVALDVDVRVGEVRLALAACGLVRAVGLVRAGHDLESLAAAAGRSLDRDRPAQLVAEAADILG